MDTLGVTSLRWLGIEMVGGCLFVAYILLGVRGNDDESHVYGNDSVIRNCIHPNRLYLFFHTRNSISNLCLIVF